MSVSQTATVITKLLRERGYYVGSAEAQFIADSIDKTAELVNEAVIHGDTNRRVIYLHLVGKFLPAAAFSESQIARCAAAVAALGSNIAIARLSQVTRLRREPLLAVLSAIIGAFQDGRAVGEACTPANWREGLGDAAYDWMHRP